MGETITITCDFCESAIEGKPNYPAGYNAHIVLDLAPTPTPPSGMVYAIGYKRKLDGPKHFCNLKCTSGWLRKQGVQPEAQDKDNAS